MEKSIESIWKEGFTNHTVSIPEINDIDGLKSIYFIDKFKKTYKTNIIVLIATAIITLFAFILGDVPFIGMLLFTLFSSLAFLGKKELDKLDHLNKGDNSYQFLKAFDHWLKNLLANFSIVYRIWVPLFFICFAFGVLQTSLFVPFIGETLMERLVGDANLLTAMPILVVTGIIAIAIALSYYSNRIFKLEIKSIYGDLITTLDSLLSEMEKLR